MRDFSDLDAYFGSGGGGGGGANPESWKRYAKPQQDPRFKSKAARPGEGPTNQAYDPSANVNQRAFQDNGYAKPAVSGDPETDKLLGEAQDTYFGPRLSLRDPNDQSGAPPQYTGEDQHPYFGQAEKPLNEGRDPAGHQALAAMPDGVADARRTYSDAVRGADADLNDAIRDANAPRHGLAGFLKRIGNDDMELEQQKAAKIANAQAIHQAKIAAANATYRAVLPQDFAAVVPGKDPKYQYNDATGKYYNVSNPRDQVDGGPVTPDVKKGPRVKEIGTDADGNPVPVFEDGTVGPVLRGPNGKPLEAKASQEDKWAAALNRGESRDANRSAEADKRFAQERADRISSEIDRTRREKRRAAAAWKANPMTSDQPFDSSDYDDDIAASQAKLDSLLGTSGRGAAPTTSQPPPTQTTGNTAPGVRGKVAPEMSSGGPPSTAPAAAPSGMPPKWVNYIMSLPEGQPYTIPGKGSFAKKNGKIVKVS